MPFRPLFGCGPLLLCMVLLPAAGCGSAVSRSTIMVIPRDTAEEVWVSEHGGAVDAALKHRLRIYWNGPSGYDDVEQQIALIERAAAGHYYGLIVSPNNSFALSNAIESALSSGMPIVITSEEVSIAPQPGLFFVLNDAKRMGALAAQRMNAILRGKGTVAILGLDAVSPGMVERANAFEQTLHQIAPQIKVAAKVAAPYNFGQAELAAEQILRAYPDLAGIFSVGNNYTMGALAAVHSMAPPRRPRIIGCDQLLDSVLLLRRGELDALVVEDTRTMGYRAVEEIAAQRAGHPGPSRVLVEPVLVDRENVNDAAIQRILSVRWRPQQ